MSGETGLLSTPIIAILATFGALLVFLRIISFVVRRYQVADEEQSDKEAKKRAKERRKLVEKSIKTMIFGAPSLPTDEKDDPASSGSRNGLTSIFVLKANRNNKIGNSEHAKKPPTTSPESNDPSGNEEDHMTCHICLCDYERGQEVCSSQNGHCDHMFHKSCIFEWLLKHNECPCCRRDFISVEKAPTEKSPPEESQGVNVEYDNTNNDTDLEEGLP